MSYLTEVEMELYVREDQWDEFSSRLSNLKVNEEWFIPYRDLEMGTNGKLIIDDGLHKWSNPEYLYDFLKDYVNAGTITGWGEYFGDSWRIRFDGLGRWIEQVPIFVDDALVMSNGYRDGDGI